MYVLLSRTQAGPGRTVKQEQVEISRIHVQTFICPSVCTLPSGSNSNSIVPEASAPLCLSRNSDNAARAHHEEWGIIMSGGFSGLDTDFTVTRNAEDFEDLALVPGPN